MNPEIEQTFILKELLKNRIEQSNGWIPFDLFFNTAMYEPGLGYYSSGSYKIGQGGDFTTAPEISKYFSKAIAFEKYIEISGAVVKSQPCPILYEPEE